MEESEIIKSSLKMTYRLILMVLLLIVLFPASPVAGQSNQQTVYVIPVDGEITPGMAISFGQ